jgi:hypothetical protein
MKLRTSLAAAGAAVALATTGALVLTGVASAHDSSHTLRFISVQKATVVFTKTTQGQQDTDVNAAGKTVGFNELYVAGDPATSTGAVNATVDTTGGLLYSTFTVAFKTGVVTDGKVTGGTGAFAGATGTFKAKAINKAGTKYAITISYSG